MAQEQIDLKSPWTVRMEDEDFPLKNFNAAIAYADGLASKRKLVKHIHPERHLIALLPPEGYIRSYELRDVS